MGRKGFKTVEVIFTFVLLLAVVFGAVKLFQEIRRDNEVPVQTIERNIPDGWVKHTEYVKDAGEYISFWHPEDWAIDHPKENNGARQILWIKSSDFIGERDPVYKSYQLVVQGAWFVFSYSTNDNPDEIIDARVASVASDWPYTSEVSDKLSIGGKRAVAQGYFGEGPAHYTTYIASDLGFYKFGYVDVPFDDDKRSTDINSAEFYNEYMSILSSFEIN